MVKPLAESLDKLDKQHAVMDDGIKSLTKETDQLANAMRKPTSRGDWGEMILVQTLQNAGMVEGQHFDVEDSTEDAEGGRKRPDVVIHLPNARDIIIDAKTPLEAFTEGMNAPDEAIRRERFAHHARLVKNHIVHLSSKKYWERYGKSADFVILFLPTEGAYQAAIQADPSLLDQGQSAKVYLANPVSVMSMVHLAHTTWKQKEFVESAEIVRAHAAELYKRLAAFISHMQSMGSSLQRSVNSYNAAVGSLELQVLPEGRRIQELKATEAKEIEPMLAVTTDIRALTSPEARAALPLPVAEEAPVLDMS
jgi:DNA recombination protein RmuC